MTTGKPEPIHTDRPILSMPELYRKVMEYAYTDDHGSEPYYLVSVDRQTLYAVLRLLENCHGAAIKLPPAKSVAR